LKRRTGGRNVAAPSVHSSILPSQPFQAPAVCSCCRRGLLGCCRVGDVAGSGGLTSGGTGDGWYGMCRSCLVSSDSGLVWRRVARQGGQHSSVACGVSLDYYFLRPRAAHPLRPSTSIHPSIRRRPSFRSDSIPCPTSLPSFVCLPQPMPSRSFHLLFLISTMP